VGSCGAREAGGAGKDTADHRRQASIVQRHRLSLSLSPILALDLTLVACIVDWWHRFWVGARDGMGQLASLRLSVVFGRRRGGGFECGQLRSARGWTEGHISQHRRNCRTATPLSLALSCSLSLTHKLIRSLSHTHTDTHTHMHGHTHSPLLL